MKSILVPTDFSECADYAAQVAIILASKTGAGVSFLHIMPNPNEGSHVPHGLGASPRSAEKIEARNKLTALVKKAEEESLNAKQFLVFDKGNEKIENYIKPLDIDFIVMGSHGVSGIRELVIGSNTQRVVRNSPVPVLVVKHPGANEFQIKNIVYASAFQGNDHEALKLITEMARLWESCLNIIFIRTQENETGKIDQERIIKQLKEENPSLTITSSNIEVNDEEWGIHQFARLVDADIIALTTHDQSGFLVHHNVAEELANHEDLPVLIVNN
jgi:nucleotide-binding universal stress UspA family protein